MGGGGGRSGERTCLPPMWPVARGPTGLAVGSRPCSEDFFRVLRFSSLPKNQHFQIPNRPETHGQLPNEFLVTFFL